MEQLAPQRMKLKMIRNSFTGLIQYLNIHDAIHYIDSVYMTEPRTVKSSDYDEI